MPSYSGVWNLVAVYQAVGAGNWNPPNLSGDIALFSGGKSAAETNVVEYVIITTTGNATDFGDLLNTGTGYSLSAGCASDTRGINAGFGNATGVGTIVNVIQYVTINSKGNFQDFGDLTNARDGVAACSNITRGVFGGGYQPTIVNTIDYITIATTGNATSFGALSVTRYGANGVQSSTRGCFGGGYTGSYSNVIDYVTIATTANATDFGDLTVARSYAGTVCSTTRGCFGGGTSPNTNVIDYITIATTGNAIDFGDLTVARYPAGAGSTTRGLFAGGLSTSNVIDYITIASAGNATDFGDLNQNTFNNAGLSNCHGGL